MQINLEKVSEWCHTNRHKILLAGLFVSFILPEVMETLFLFRVPFPIIALSFILSSVFIINKQRKYTSALTIVLISLMVIWALYRSLAAIETASFGLLFVYFCIVSYFLYLDVLKAEEITESVVIGAFTGYVMIGIIFFFVFTALDINYPDTLSTAADTSAEYKEIFYFSFVTITTIGYGDIVPVSALGQKLVVLEAVFGQFYLAAVMATIVSKFIIHRSSAK